MGRIWTEGREVRFQEDGTGFLVTAVMPNLAGFRGGFMERDLLLLKGMSAEHKKARSIARQRAREASLRAIVPVSAGDMAVKRILIDGKLVYCWCAEQGGRAEVAVTPRGRRKRLEEGASAHRQKLARETTPERALRKMKDKVQKLRAKAAKGQHERIVARALEAPISGAGTATSQSGTRSPAPPCDQRGGGHRSPGSPTTAGQP